MGQISQNVQQSTKLFSQKVHGVNTDSYKTMVVPSIAEYISALREGMYELVF